MVSDARNYSVTPMSSRHLPVAPFVVITYLSSTLSLPIISVIPMSGEPICIFLEVYRKTYDGPLHWSASYSSACSLSSSTLEVKYLRWRSRERSCFDQQKASEEKFNFETKLTMTFSKHKYQNMLQAIAYKPMPTANFRSP